MRQQCLQQSRSIVETEFLGGDSALSSAALEMLEDELVTEVPPLPRSMLFSVVLPKTKHIAKMSCGAVWQSLY